MVPTQGGHQAARVRLRISSGYGAAGFAVEGGDFLSWDAFFLVLNQLREQGGNSTDLLLQAAVRQKGGVKEEENPFPIIIDILVAAGLCLPAEKGWMLGEALRPAPTPMTAPLTLEQRQRVRAWIDQETQFLESAWITLANQNPFLCWEAFEAALELLNQEDRDFLPGIAQGGPLGSGACPLDSVEGYVARTVYGKQGRESCFMRIVPLRGILLFCGLISRKSGRGGRADCSSRSWRKNYWKEE